MSIEQETREYFALVAKAIALVLFWMIAGVFFGMFLGMAYTDLWPRWVTVLFYIIYSGLFILLFRWLRKKWRH